MRVSKKTRATLPTPAMPSGKPIQVVTKTAVDLYRRQRRPAQIHAAYAQLRADLAAQRALAAEGAALDETLMDSLEDEVAAAFARSHGWSLSVVHITDATPDAQLRGAALNQRVPALPERDGLPAFLGNVEYDRYTIPF